MLPAFERRRPGVEIDADQNVRLGHVGADVAAGDIAQVARNGVEAAGDIAGLWAGHRCVRRARDGDGETVGPEQRQGVQLDRERFGRLVHRLTRLRDAHTPRVDAAVAGVEEDRLMAITRGRCEGPAGSRLEDGGVDGVTPGRAARGGNDEGRRRSGRARRRRRAGRTPPGRPGRPHGRRRPSSP